MEESGLDNGTISFFDDSICALVMSEEAIAPNLLSAPAPGRSLRIGAATDMSISVPAGAAVAAAGAAGPAAAPGLAELGLLPPLLLLLLLLPQQLHLLGLLLLGLLGGGGLGRDLLLPADGERHEELDEQAGVQADAPLHAPAPRPPHRPLLPLFLVSPRLPRVSGALSRQPRPSNHGASRRFRGGGEADGQARVPPPPAHLPDGGGFHLERI